MKTFLGVAGQKDTVVASAKVALAVGSVLAVLNYGDRIFLRHDMRALDWTKLVVSYCVPYCVATYGAARYAMRHSSSEKEPDPQ
jgi:hypothetical protein